MSYVLLRSMKVQKADGSYEMRQPGAAVPEAANWPNPGVWVKRGYIRPTDGKAVVMGERAARQPMRAVTDADLEDWQNRKVSRENGTLDEPAPAPEETAEKFTEDQLLAMTKDELLELAEGFGITAEKKATKADLAQAILDAQG